MSDGQEVPNEFPVKGRKTIVYHIPEQHTTIIQTLCWGCGAMIEDVIEGENGWFFCLCGTGIMKVETVCMGEGE